MPGRQVSGSARDAVQRQASKHESAAGAKTEKATKVDKTKIIQEETSATGKVGAILIQPHLAFRVVNVVMSS